VKDMIISGGENVYPAEVEAVAVRLDAVAECAVVGVPDERWGEVVVAVVVPQAAGAVDEAAVHEACEALGRYKRPRSVILREDPLPRTVTQKVLKRELRPWVQDHVTGPAS
jgi:acyl-CoA synthetase (AMP-forming)/AMP-acid ligase II